MFSTWEYTSYTMKIVSEKHQLFIGVYLFIHIVYGVQINLVHWNSPLGHTVCILTYRALFIICASDYTVSFSWIISMGLCPVHYLSFWTQSFTFILDEVSYLTRSLDSFLSASIFNCWLGGLSIIAIGISPFFPVFFTVYSFSWSSLWLQYSGCNTPLSIGKITKKIAQTFTNTFDKKCAILDLLGCRMDFRHPSIIPNYI